jgi:hypothetical protein
MQSLKTRLQGLVLGKTVNASSLLLVTGDRLHVKLASDLLTSVISDSTIVYNPELQNPAAYVKAIKHAQSQAKKVILAVAAEQLDALEGLSFSLVAVRGCENLHQAEAIDKVLKKSPKFIVLNHDDTYFNQFDQHPPVEQSVTYGVNLDADCRLTSARLSKKGSQLTILLDRKEEIMIVSHFEGKQRAYDSLMAFAVGYALKVPSAEIVNSLESVQPLKVDTL